MHKFLFALFGSPLPPVVAGAVPVLPVVSVSLFLGLPAPPLSLLGLLGIGRSNGSLSFSRLKIFDFRSAFFSDLCVCVILCVLAPETLD